MLSGMACYLEEIEKALIYKDMEKVKRMLAAGEDINKRRGFNRVTLLHIAPNLEITKELISLGAKVCVKNSQQQTALHYATMYLKEVGVIEELLANGAEMDIYAADEELSTPLHYAIRNNKDPDAALLLLSKGARPNMRDIKNRTPLHYAAMDDREYRLIRQLLFCGADVHMRDIHGRTPLHYAAINSTEHFGILEMLRYSADPNAKDNRGRTPLHYAIINNRKSTFAEQLLKKGADVNLRDDNGFSALYLLAESDFVNLDAIKTLLEYGADIHIGRDEFWPFYSYCTPLEQFFYKREVDCAKILIKITLLKDFDTDKKKFIIFDRYKNYPDYGKVLSYKNECLRELSKMAEEQITSEFTLYEFVRMKNGYRKPLYLSSLIFQQILSNYPIYKDLIKPCFQYCLQRASLLQKTKHLTISSWSQEIDHHLGAREILLHSDCVYKICEYLSNRDLIKCFEASIRRSDIS